MPVSYAVVGGGVIGSATAMVLARRGCPVTLFEAESEVGLAASGTNAGVLHTGFNGTLGELETALILRAAPLWERAVDGLGIPIRRCGARMRNAPREIEDNARMLGVPVTRDGADLLIPGEAVTNPIAMTRAFCAEAERHGAVIRPGEAVQDDLPGFSVVLNCAGLHADEVARRFGDDSFAIRPRKGEFVVFQNPGLEEILLPDPSSGTRDLLIVPTVTGHICCGPTDVDVDDRSDWAVRAQARVALTEQVRAALPGVDLAPVFAYAGLRPTRVDGESYVIGWSAYSDRLLNVAAIGSSGLTSALGVADYVCTDLLGIDERPLGYQRVDAPRGPWWLRAAHHRRLA